MSIWNNSTSCIDSLQFSNVSQSTFMARLLSIYLNQNQVLSFHSRSRENRATEPMFHCTRSFYITGNFYDLSDGTYEHKYGHPPLLQSLDIYGGSPH